MVNYTFQEMNSLKDKTISSFFWRLLERGGNQAVALIVQVIMARLLAPSDFGLLAILLVVVNVGNILVQSGLNSALIQTADIHKRDFSTVLWMSLSIAIVLYTLVFILAPYLASFYSSPILESTLRVISLILPIYAVSSVFSAYIQRDLDFKKVFNATVAATFTSGILGIAAAIIGLGLWALVIQQISYALVNCIALGLQAKWKPRFVFEIQSGIKHLKYGWKILIPSLLETGYDSLSDMIVGRQFGTEPLGYLSQGKKYPVALDSMIGGTVQPVMFAAVSRAQKSISDVKSIVKRTLKTSYFFVAPIMMTFALTAEPIVLLLLGEQWLSAVPFMQMYCLTSGLSSFHAINYQTFNGMGRSDLFLKVKLITVSYGVVFLLIACFIVQNIYAVTIAYMAASLISTFVNSFPTKKLIGYSYFEQVRDIAPSIVLATTSVAVASFAAALPLPIILVAILQWIISFTCYFLLSKLFKVEELTYLIATTKEMINKNRTK